MKKDSGCGRGGRGCYVSIGEPAEKRKGTVAEEF